MGTKRKLMDLAGQQFGQWSVIEEASRRKDIRYWRCMCTCGTEKEVAQRSLVHGASKSCGCYSDTKRGRKRLDLTGHTYGNFTVLREAETQNASRYWLCKCICGNELKVPHRKLVNTSGESCTCNQKRGPKRSNLTGRIYGQFTVLREAASRNGKRYWLCQCTRCGTTKEVYQPRLTKGTIKPCACSQDLDLTRNTYSHLTVKESTDKKKESLLVMPVHVWQNHRSKTKPPY